MANVWTHGTWTVVPGREEEFVAVWKQLAREGAEELAAQGTPTLLRDRDRPNRFISFGPWPDVDAVERFRSSRAFREGQERMRDLLESFEPGTLDEVARGG